MLNRLSIRSKLAIVVGVPLLALALMTVIGWRLISTNTIGSKSYNSIIETSDLVADILPPPGYPIEARADLLELVNSNDPAVQADLAADIRQKQVEYNASYQRWLVDLQDQPELLTQLKASHEPIQQWFDEIENNVVPEIGVGTQDDMSQIQLTTLDPLFDQHRAEVVKLVKLSSDQREALRKSGSDSTKRNTFLAAAIALLLGLLTAALGVLISRAIGRPIRQLTTAARKAEADLPVMLASINSNDEMPAMEQLKVESSDELGELAVALNSMQTAAVNLAADQARSRRNVSTMLANLARRNQGLLNRTLAFITRLEENERDPEALDNLFKLDHLTTRMRRNAESLLVLAGSEAPRSWAQPIEIGNVIRAAMSEIEAFDRVEVASMDPVMVRGNAVSDVAHLLAELLDNATRFSPPSTTVSIVGKDSEAGYLISVIDQGMGMTAEQLASANHDIETVGRFEEGSTMVLGLAVVARLAARNSVAVRLSESPFEGVTAQIRLPAELLERRTLSTDAAPSESAEVDELDDAPVVTSSYSPADAATNASMGHINGSSTAVIDSPALVTRSLIPTEFPPPSFTPPTSTAAADLGITAPGNPFDQDDEPEQEATAEHAVVAATNNHVVAEVAASNGLARRVPGTNLFESTLPDAGPTQNIDRSAEDIRDALSSFQQGFQSAPKGTEAE
jgi:signal transduction histidine kinase